MERFFNTAGPNRPDFNYTLDPLKRFDLDEILLLIRQAKYFVLHAPRQTGKTSCLLALRDYLNSHDDYICVYANVEGGQGWRNDVQKVVAATCQTIARETNLVLDNDVARDILARVRKEDAESMLSAFLTQLCQSLSESRGRRF